MTTLMRSRPFEMRSNVGGHARGSPGRLQAGADSRDEEEQALLR